MRTRIWIFALLVAGSAHAESLRIGTVTVRVTPLFSAAEVSRGGFYRAANFFQVPTHERFIRGFLLFHEGDELDEAKIRESERNLRQLDFLESVSITTGTPHDGVVDVVVATTDAWTMDVDVEYSNDGEIPIYSFALKEENLFNRGGAVELRDDKELFRHTTSLEVTDAELFGPYWNADGVVRVNSDGNEERFAIDRPLFSYAAPWTAALSFDHLLQDGRTFQNGGVATVFRQSHREGEVEFGRVVRARPTSMARLLAAVDFIDDSFRPVRGIEPDDRHFHFAEAGVDRTRFHWVAFDHVDFGMRKQDFNLGAHASLFAAVSPPLAGHGVVGRLRSDDSYGYALGPSSFVVTHLTGTTRLGDARRNAILSDDTHFVLRLSEAHPQTIVARARVDIGWEVDRDVQFLVDAQNGLRAYPNLSFEGTRRAVLNIEDRLFLGRELFQLVEPGVAAFVDTGEAVNGGFTRHGLRTDFGVGLRASISRFDSTMLRLDLAYALNDSPTSRRGFEVSFATIQAF